jgi:dolichol-phosphate mannosyltransferase
VHVIRFIKFSASSIIGFLADNLVFAGVLFAVEDHVTYRRTAILLSLVVARLASATLNYVCNRKFVFHSHAEVASSFVRYWVLVGIVAVLSYAGTSAVSWVGDLRGWAIPAAKILVETVLFILSYKAQRRWVFSRLATAKPGKRPSPL